MVIATPICSVYLNGTPIYPDNSDYKNQELTLGDPVCGKKLYFLPWNGCLVAARSICKGITGQQLAGFGFVEGKAIVIDGRRYLCRCPRIGDKKGDSEWDNIVKFYGGVKTSFWNPNDRSWTQKFSSYKRLQFACGGFTATDRSLVSPGDHSSTLGFRPILEPLDPLWVDESHVGKTIQFFGTGGSVSGVLSQTDDYDFVLDLGPDNVEIMGRDLNALPWVSPGSPLWATGWLWWTGRLLFTQARWIELQAGVLPGLSLCCQQYFSP